MNSLTYIILIEWKHWDCFSRFSQKTLFGLTCWLLIWTAVYCTSVKVVIILPENILSTGEIRQRLHCILKVNLRDSNLSKILSCS